MLGREIRPGLPVLAFDRRGEVLCVFRPRQAVAGWRGGPSLVTAWRPATGELLARWSADELNARGRHELVMAISDGAGLIATTKASDDRAIVLRELATGGVLARLAGPPDGAVSLAFSPDGRALASGGLDGTVLLWDLTAAWPRRHALRRRLSEAQWEALWADLASTDAVRGRSALGALVAAPAFTVGRLRGQLRPVPSVKRRVDALIERLASDSFTRRQSAERDLAAMGDAVVRHLRAALAQELDLEQRTRVLRLLARLKERPLAGEELRERRAVEAVETIGTPGAAALLRALAGGDGAARLTVEAKLALGRVERQRKK